MIDYGQRVIKVIRDVDFMEWPEAEEDSFNEICCNADCPLCADYCTVADTPGVCRYEDRKRSEEAES